MTYVSIIVIVLLVIMFWKFIEEHAKKDTTVAEVKVAEEKPVAKTAKTTKKTTTAKSTTTKTAVKTVAKQPTKKVKR